MKAAPSTVSEQIKKLEKTLSKKLFNRSSKGLFLTPDGQTLFKHAEIMFEEGSKLLEKFSEDDIGGYPVKIGLEETVSYDLAIDFASQYWDFYAHYGTVNTFKQAEHEVLIDNLLKGHIDWGISLRKTRRKDLGCLEIGSFEVAFFCSNELYSKFKDAKDLMNNIPFAESYWDKSLNNKVYNYLRKNGVVPKEKIYSDHTEFIKKLCERGRCVMFMAKNPLQSYKDLKPFHLGEPIKINLYAVWKKTDEGLISIKKLKELIQSNFSQLPERYQDVDLQIEVSEVSEDLLKD